MFASNVWTLFLFNMDSQHHNSISMRQNHKKHSMTFLRITLVIITALSQLKRGTLDHYSKAGHTMSPLLWLLCICQHFGVVLITEAIDATSKRLLTLRSSFLVQKPQSLLELHWWQVFSWCVVTQTLSFHSTSITFFCLLVLAWLSSFPLPLPGLEPYLVHAKPRFHPVFSEHCAGLATMPLPLDMCPHLPHLPPQPQPGLHMHEPPQQS